MVKPVVISSIGVVGAGAIATGVFFANKSDTYSSYLEKIGRKLLGKEETGWDTLKTRYDAENEGLQITLSGQTTPAKTIEVQQLKSWCSENANKTFTKKEDTTFLSVSAWCTAPKTIEGQIGTSKTILNVAKVTSGTTNNHENLWKGKETEYKKSTNTNLIKEIQSNEEKADIATSAVTVDKLKDWCNLSKGKHFKHDKDTRYLKFLEWCVN
ncbi:hypothetical protein A6V39_04505 [Candidatus Mycoplasma haematobovis]|uniref:Uncharacterized protein n=1 Tax=Candidatus Mycoplasma haematobovis TaxID=432608 RepID=A0A1A9QDW6_9MOLU|nr:hypothetical protein [Candidatus Mycoplasma haematobovis]OAL10146.1 hypothetical protein A6V39_04505 [Candidatus Mycoplasma haematobovis]